MSEYTLKPLSRAEKLYAYKQSQQIAGQTGCFGYYHGDFGNSGEDYNAVWFGSSNVEMNDDFRNDLAEVMETLGNDEATNKPFFDRRSMRDYCYTHKEASIKGNFGDEYGFRLNTDKFTYIIRMEPFRSGDYDFYVFAYETRWLDRHMKKAAKDIRFIRSDYSLMFKLEDGDKIMIKYPDGSNKLQECRFIDEYHTQIGNSIYHICQFAELMERNGATVIPMRSSLPETAYHYLKDRKKIEVIVQGNDEPYEINAPYTDDKRNMEEVDKLNAENNVSKKQLGAMVVGSVLGWDDKGADPRNYNENGKFIKNTRNRDDYER